MLVDGGVVQDRTAASWYNLGAQNDICAVKGDPCTVGEYKLLVSLSRTPDLSLKNILFASLPCGIDRYC